MTKYLFIVLLFVTVNLKAQNKALSLRNANYDMDVRLNPETKIITGKMKLKWINISPDTLSELQFHLYLNAFKNSESTFMKESGGRFRGDRAGNDDLSWGYVNIQSMKIQDGENLTNKIQFISPDDGNKNDQTAIRVPLKDSIFPGDTINILINFESKLPKIFARTGFAGNYFLVGQWFPKIAVYEPAGMRARKTGGWNCHQFHAHSEFYADFGVYHVKITLPKDYIVGATGKQLSETVEGDLKTVKYRAKDVIDFAWTASPRFKVVMDKWNDVQIKLLIQPEHEDLADRHIESAKAALEYFDKHLGPYPFSTLTIVDPPVTGGGSGGMEYPTFITAGSFAKIPAGMRMIEMVTIHEFGHQYFMGMLATNEFEEAWMDEGMNSYFETRIMDETYGEKTSFIDIAGFRVGDLEMQRNGYVYNVNRKLAESYRYAWHYQQGAYSTMSYNKPATFLNTLHRLVGDEINDEIWKTYYKTWQFAHPSTPDFLKIVNEVVTERKGLDFAADINDFLVQAIYGSDICDYKVARVSSRWINDPQGILDGLQIKQKADSAKIYESRVVIKREGEMIMPVEILIRFNNGKEITKYWDGKSRSTEFKFRSAARVVSAKIDPDNKNLMDVNLANNSYVVRPDDKPAWKYAVKFLFWLQNIIQSVVWFV
ncbi:MAG: M1 family metallopeptidase [Bacteroidales bacterium]|nr:M1 family metallopeptidase [Bacteroidales bacterium]